MEKLRIRQALWFLFRSQDWLKRMLTIIALIFLPIIGWFAIVGYYLRISERWLREEYEGLPNFSGFGELIVNGLLFSVVCLVYGIPQFILALIPCFGGILSTAYNLLLGLIYPYLISVVATDKAISSRLFDFSAIIKFVQENILNLLKLFLVGLVVVFALLVLAAPFIAAGVLFLVVPQDTSGTLVPAIIVFCVAAIIIVFGGLWWCSVYYALSGNIVGIWNRAQSKPAANVPFTVPEKPNPNL